MKRVCFVTWTLCLLLGQQLQADELATMRSNLREYITVGDIDYNPADTEIQGYINRLESHARHYQKSILPAPATCLWEDLPYLTGNPPYTPYHLHKSYKRLHTMALAWAYPSSSCYRDSVLLHDIRQALSFLYRTAYNEHTPMIGNWWEWRIGIPEDYAHIVSIIYNELTQDELMQFSRSIQTFVRDFAQYGNMTFANQASICRNLLFAGILTDNEEDISCAIEHAQQALCDETTIEERKAAQAAYEDLLHRQASYKHNTIVWKKEGLYQDGTFIQHIALPYIGTYGAEIIEMAADMVKLFKGTQYSIPEKIREVLPIWIEKAYLPAIYKGEMMLMFMGRGVAREPYFYAGKVALDISEASQLLPADKRETICRQLQDYRFYPSENTNPIVNLPRIAALKAGTTKEKNTPNRFNIVLAAGDRVIHQRDSFRLGIAMSSCRIGKYEAMRTTNKEENIQGWYSADGMTYLYNDREQGHYYGYFETVNPYHLPGTTVDVKQRDNTCYGMALFNQVADAPDWVGGTMHRGEYGCAGMLLRSAVSDLQARKAWFMFDNEVVCLGADITMSEQREVLTVVENRRNTQPVHYNPEASTVNTASQGKELHTHVRYAHLPNTGGYYFPTPVTLHTELTPQGHTELYLSHGLCPVQEQYAYVLLPGLTQAETALYANRPQIEIISNTARLQAVRDRQLNITGVCFWQAGKVENISCNAPAAVMLEEHNDTLWLSLAEPTWREDRVAIALDGQYTLLQATPQESITLSVQGNKTLLDFNTKDRMGQTNQVILHRHRSFGALKP